jgi:M6 family metalloprotease-like protein
MVILGSKHFSGGKMKIKTIMVIIALFLGQLAYGVSISPEIIKQLKENGQLQSIVQADRNARVRGVWSPNQHPYRFGTTTDVDTLHCLIVLVDFSDMTHEAGLNSEPTDFDTLLFSEGIRQTGSMTDYYHETSYGQAFLTGQITQWYRMPETYAYYVDGQRGFGGYPNNAQRLTEDAVTAADPDIDFSLYDNNGDGWVDALFVVHAGPGYEDTGNLNYIHSHTWVTSYQMNVDGVIVYGYSMEPEETAAGRLVTIGVFCHEFGHVLGLPDLYDYDYDSDGVGSWSIMAGGSWGGGGAIPVHFDGWSKFHLGWAIPTVLTDNLIHEQIDAVEYSPDTYQLFSEGQSSTEYFLVENRRRELFDRSLPGDGLLIYHIDETVPDNNNQDHYKVAVEQADGLYNLEHNQGSDNGDPWPGSTDNLTFDDFSTPNSRFYSGQLSEVGVGNISNSDSIMYANLSIMSIDPLYQLLGSSFTDTAGNNNGQPEAGETCHLIFSAQNVRAGVPDLTVAVSCSDADVIISDSLSSFGSLPINTPFDNQSDPIIFSLPNDYQSNFVTFTLTFTARGGLYNQILTFRAILGTPNLLLVDDDGGASIDTFYTNALSRIGRAYRTWDISTSGSPASIMNQYEYIIWFTGATRPDPMPADNVAAIISYLNGGGRFLITSQDFVQRLSERGSVQDTTLLNQYLKVGYDRNETDHHPQGQPGTGFDSLAYLTSGSGGANDQLSQDALTISSGAILVMTYRTGRPAGVAVTGNYVAITLGFGAEAANEQFPAVYDSMFTLINASLTYLSRPVSVANPGEMMPSNFTLEQNYPNPFNPSTMISFRIPNPEHVRLSIYDIQGRLIDVPIDKFLEAGKHALLWNGEDYSSGIYFVRLSNGTYAESIRMILMK